ncbi:hypothetical protein D6783_04395 [Candidatus Woesearchaeota archaeon]|nr:MAG: hypothetical protein D6783_04395 [Candidatus Woesearchaeota archaeon]
MKNTIHFLGTGGDAITVGKQILASGGIILTLEDNQFHLDPGPGALVKAKDYGINLREHIGVFISQNTLIHANDANAVVFGMTHGGLDRFGVIVCTQHARHKTNPQGLLFEESERHVERVILLDEVDRISINHIDIQPIPLKREATGAIGFRFATQNNSVAYISDTSYYDGLAAACKKPNVMIVWCRHPSSVTEKGTLNTDNITALLTKVKPKACFLTGFGIKLLDAGLVEQARAIQRKTKVTVIVAKDGLEADLDIYADKTKQTKLKR